MSSSSITSIQQWFAAIVISSSYSSRLWVTQYHQVCLSSHDSNWIFKSLHFLHMSWFQSWKSNESYPIVKYCSINIRLEATNCMMVSVMPQFLTVLPCLRSPMIVRLLTVPISFLILKMLSRTRVWRPPVPSPALDSGLQEFVSSSSLQLQALGVSVPPSLYIQPSQQLNLQECPLLAYEHDSIIKSTWPPSLCTPAEKLQLLVVPVSLNTDAITLPLRMLTKVLSCTDIFLRISECTMARRACIYAIFSLLELSCSVIWMSLALLIAESSQNICRQPRKPPVKRIFPCWFSSSTAHVSGRASSSDKYFICDITLEATNFIMGSGRPRFRKFSYVCCTLYSLSNLAREWTVCYIWIPQPW